ncbi:MAG TPA: hypothetical protein PLY70_02210 [Saprospiraceae bacterium]|nr:hypothetical protein [Saprospiraceae bacterium]HPN68037.1 hypothetical protein [Saprospiraceae bacterium]
MRVIFFLIIFGISCQSKIKPRYLRSDVVKTGYYCDHFKIDSYGVGGDVYSLYLTDSISFREFVCNYHDNDVFEYLDEGNKIEILKYEDKSTINGVLLEKKLLNRYVFDLIKLKEQD